MSYTINLTNGAIFATIPDGTRDTSSSLVIIGKNYEGYGEFIGENFLHTLENHANTSPPSNPLVGQLWYDLNESNIKVYNGTLFKTLGATVTQLDEPPLLTSVTGDIWYDTTTQQVKVYNGSAYELVGPLYTVITGKTGPLVETLIDTGANEHVATINYVEGEVVSISHKDTAFALQTPITGFAGIIYPGTQLSTNVTGETPQFTGTATNAELLDNVDSTGYLSALNDDTTAGTLGVLNDGGLLVGADGDLAITVTGADAFITNSTTGGRLVIQATSSTGTKDVITIASVVDKAYARVTEVPVNSFDITNMDYVDTTTIGVDGTRAMQADLDLGTHKITNVVDPIDLQDVATKNYVLNLLLDQIYQVGSYFFGPEPVNLPGTWVQLAAGTFLMASSSGNGTTGGTNITQLTTDQLPTHNHTGYTNTDTHFHKMFQDSNTVWRSLRGGYGNYTVAAGGTGNGGPDDIYQMGASTSTDPNTATLGRSGYDSHNHSVTTYNNGSSYAYDSRPQYEEVEVWKRTA